MKHAILLFLLMLALPLSAQVTGHVVDAETGEPLPYVQVRVDDERHTITNNEGDFALEAGPNERITLSSIGYTTQHYTASRLPQMVKMKALDHSLNSVTVVSWEKVLINTGKQLQKDLSKHESKRSKYFFRMTNQLRYTEMVEALLEARSAANLRDIKFLRGRRGRMTQQGLTSPLIADMNFHHPLEVALVQPLTRSFWNGMTHPMYTKSDFSYLRKHYDVEGEIVRDSTGREMYCITLSKLPSNNNRRLILTGTLWVDAKTTRPLRFDGQIENMQIEMKHDFRSVTAPIDLRLHIDYTQRKGYTEVDNLSAVLESGDLENKMLLFNVDNMPLSRVKGKTTGENMLASIDKAGNDEKLWDRDEIVARTREERALVEHEKTHVAEHHDDIDAMVQRLDAFSQRIPQEKVYLHMDNTSYFVGDTIRFAAYTRQTDSDLPSHISGVLYVELLNQDGYLVERKMVDMKEGRGQGSFVLDEDCYGGFYELRAYTRWQLNWGVTERHHSRQMNGMFLNQDFEDRYFRDYDKLYSRVFPVYDQPVEPGVYNEHMTLRAMRRVYKNDPDKPHLTLTLYPEGGELVQGVESTVAYEACWSDGRWAEGTLTVGDQQIAVENRGRSTFQYTPHEGKRKVTFTDNEGNQASAELPKALTEGGTMHLWQQDSCWQMRLALTEGMKPDSVAWTVLREGRLQCTGRMTEHNQVVTLPADLPGGVLQATLFDHNGRVLADRLFFVMPKDMGQSNLSVEGAKEMYQPYEQIQLEVRSQLPKGRISLSVRDGALGDALFDNASMWTEMLLCSEIKGFVPNPEWFFERDDAERRRALDLLMLTQGWRRFVWRDMAVRGTWDLSQPDEPAPVLIGQVLKLDETPFYGMEAVSKSDTRDDFWDVDYSGVLNYYDPTFQVEHKWQVSEEDPPTYIPSLLDDWGMVKEPEQPTPPIPMSTRRPAGTDALGIVESFRDDIRRSHVKTELKREVLVHAEMVSLDGKTALTSEQMTRNGKFRILLPKTKGDYLLHLAASDPTTWDKSEKGGKHVWIQAMPSERSMPLHKGNKLRVDPSELAVRVDFPYPRYVQPYNYYQKHIDTAFDPLSASPDILLDDGSTLLKEVTIKNRRTKHYRLDQSKPAFVIDAYDAYNQALDAGMKNAEPEIIVRTLLGTYGLDDATISTVSRYAPQSPFKSWNMRVRLGYDQLRRHLEDVTLDEDSAYMYHNLASRLDMGTPGEAKYYFHSLKDKYVLYTDYCPRFWGDDRYKASNLPETQIGIFPYTEDQTRAMYRDRRYQMSGMSVAEGCYQPDYSHRPADATPQDYRRTLYWNPDLHLGADGNATVRLYNSGKQTVIHVSADGVTDDGTIVRIHN